MPITKGSTVQESLNRGGSNIILHNPMVHWLQPKQT